MRCGVWCLIGTEATRVLEVCFQLGYIFHITGSGEGPPDASSLAIGLNQGPQAAVAWQMVSGNAPCGTSVVAGKNPEESRGLRAHQVDG